MSGSQQQRNDTAGAAARTEAAERLLQAQSAGIDPERDPATAAWRHESPANDAAFRHIAQAWEEGARIKAHPAYTDLMGTPTLRERIIGFWRGLAEHRGERTPAVRWAFASVLAVLIIAGAWLLIPGPPNETYATRVAEIRDVALDDGSTVTLGARSALDVEYTSVERTVRLASGEAFFSVSRDASRPFVVLAGDTRIRVVGTKFNVHYDNGRVRVSVLVGTVEVTRADGSVERVGPSVTGAPVRLGAGQQIVIAEASPLPSPVPVNAAQPGAWREGRLDYQDAPLSEIVADANRYRAGEIRIVSPALAGERLTISFRATQIDQMLQTLPETLPLSVRRNADGSVELRARGGSGAKGSRPGASPV